MAGGWTKIEDARTFGEAMLLRDLLRNEGIEAEVRGEYRPSIAGELPFLEARVDVWIHMADVEAAVYVLKRRSSSLESVPRVCSACREENPGNFDFCWSCQEGF